MAEKSPDLLSDDIPKQPEIFKIIAGLVMIIVASVAVWASPPSDYQVQITANLDADATVIYRFDQQLWSGACEAAANSLKSSVEVACNNCQVDAICRQPSPIEEPEPENAASFALLEFKGGAALFSSVTPDKAYNLCEVSVSSVSTPEQAAFCVAGAATLPREEPKALQLLIPPALLLTLMGILFSITSIQRKGMNTIERLTTGHRQATSVITLACDCLSLYCSWSITIVGSGLYSSTNLEHGFTQQYLVGALMLLAYLHFKADHYRARSTLHGELSHIVGGIFILGLLHTTFAALIGNVSPWLPMILWTTSLFLIPLFRYLLRTTLDAHNIWRRPALVIGRGENARAARRALIGDFTLGYKTLRIRVPSTPNTDNSADYCDLDNLAHDVHRALGVAKKVKIVAALDSLQSPEAQRALSDLLAMDRNIEVVPSLRGLPALGANVSQFFGHELIMLSIQNKLTQRPQRIFKRTFDILVSTALLLVLSPLFVYLIARIKADGHSAFFSQSRVGRNGKAFMCLKFRSMHFDAEQRLDSLLNHNPSLKEEWQRNFKLANDPRVTPIGKTIRKYSLDELPQLINVLRGDMSLVGPRPLLHNELERYGDAVDLYGLVSPGITGVWQVSGRSDTSFEQRREMDEWYIRNWSIYYDMACLLKTIGVVLRSKGAY